MDIKKELFVICLLVASTLSLDQKYLTSCPVGDLPLSVKSASCSGYSCIFYRGTDGSLEMDFVANSDTTALKPRVKILIGRIKTIDVDFEQKDACTTLRGAACPLQNGQAATYILNMPVPKNLPKFLPVKIELAFLDDKNEVVVCSRIAVKLADKSTKWWWG